MIVKVSDYIANFLSDNGIKHVFTVTGGGAMHLNDAIGHHPNLKSVYCHHEQACSIAAEAYYRYSRKLPAVCVTSGPGGTNAITGVLGAWLDSIPMFVVSGQVKRETTIWSCPELKLRQLGDQEYNIVSSIASMTKYSVMITEASEIAYHLEKALFMATNGRGGPVWIDVPLDIQGAKIETDNLNHFNVSECKTEICPKINQTTIKNVYEAILKSKRPVIIAGSAIRLSGAYDDFIKLTEKLKIPVITAWNAQDVIEYDNPYFCGLQGSIGNRGGNFVVESCDLLLSIGCRLSIRQVTYSYKDFATNSYKIMVDIDEAELKKPTLNINMPIHADAHDFIQAMLNYNYSDVGKYEKWLHCCKEVNEKYPSCLPSYYKSKSPVNPYAFMDTLFKILPEDEPVVSGNGSACVTSFQAAKLKKGQRLFTNSGCASMGYGFPAAEGVAVYREGKRVICLDGDGSFQMNLQELQTVVHNKLNIKIFYLNNNGYHSIRQTQNNLFSPHPLVGVSSDNGISFPECKKIAECYGIKYYCIDNIDKSEKIVKEIISFKGPAICEVILDINQNFEPKLSSKVLPDGRIVSPPIDDMFPFLSREEYENVKKTLMEC